LAGEKIRELFLGHKVTGFSLASGKLWWIEGGRDGKATNRDGDDSDSAKCWIEEGMLRDQWDNLLIVRIELHPIITAQGCRGIGSPALLK
jgi:hypothetical protein